MNKQIAVIPVTVALALVILASAFSVQPAKATFYTVNNNPGFANSASWAPDIWTQPNMYHTYTMGNGYAYTRFAGWNGVNVWGNTEYEQGIDPWATYGNLPYPVPCTATQQLQIRNRYTEAQVDFWLGVADTYINLWIRFDSPTGSMNYQYAEIIFYMKVKDGVLYPFQAQETLTTNLRHEGSLNWYFVAYRGTDIGTSFTTRTYNVNNIINALASTWGCNLNIGDVTCITFGNEGAQGQMASEWDYLNYQVNM